MGENKLRNKRAKVINLVTLVVFCNCTIALGCLILTLLTVRLRQQLVAISQYCDRWANDCAARSTVAPGSMLESRAQIRQLRRIYRQQSGLVERLQTIGIFVQITRSLLLPRRK